MAGISIADISKYDLSDKENTVVERFGKFFESVFEKNIDLGPAPEGADMQALAKWHYLNLRGDKRDEAAEKFARYLHNQKPDHFGLRKNYVVGDEPMEDAYKAAMTFQSQQTATAYGAANSSQELPKAEATVNEPPKAGVSTATNQGTPGSMTSADADAQNVNTAELSGSEINTSSYLADLLIGKSELTRQALAVSASEEKIALDGESYTTLLAMYPGFAHQKSFVDAMMAEAKSYNLNLRDFLAKKGQGLLVQSGADKGKTVDIDLQARTREIFVNTSDLFNPGGRDANGKLKHPELSIVAFESDYEREFGIINKGKRLRLFDAEGTAYVLHPDGHVSVNLAPASADTVNGRLVKKKAAQYGAAQAYISVGLFINSRLQPNDDGSPQKISMKIGTKGLAMPDRMREIRDLNIIRALHLAQENNLDLNLSFGGKSITNAMGGIDITKLHPNAIAAMSRYGIDVEQVVQWHNKQRQALYGVPTVSLHSDTPPATEPRPLAVTPEIALGMPTSTAANTPQTSESRNASDSVDADVPSVRTGPTEGTAEKRSGISPIHILTSAAQNLGQHIAGMIKHRDQPGDYLAGGKKRVAADIASRTSKPDPGLRI